MNTETKTQTEKKLTVEERLLALEKAQLDLAEETYCAIDTIKDALEHINQTVDNEQDTTDYLEIIDKTLAVIYKMF